MTRRLAGLVIVVVAVLAACRPAPWGRNDYAAAGVPATDHGPWTDADLAHAAEVIATSAAGHPERLPLWHDPQSGEIFAQLVAPAPESALPVQERIASVIARGEAHRKISHVYAHPPSEPATREQIEIFGAQLRDFAIVESLADAFLATFDPSDPKLPVRRQGLQQMRSGIRTLLIGTLLVSADRRCSDDDRIAMIGYLAASGPALLSHLPDDAKQDLRARVATLAAATTGALHDAAAALAAQLAQVK